jgi:hypothetical protein
MRKTKGRSIRRRNKKQTKRYNGGGNEEFRDRSDSLYTQTGNAIVDDDLKTVPNPELVKIAQDANIKRAEIKIPTVVWGYLAGSLVLGGAVFLTTTLLIDK